MKVIFIGASNFGIRCLNEILNMKCCIVVGVVTAEKKFNISYSDVGVINVLHADVVGLSEEKKIPSVVMNNSMSDESLLATVKSWEPDVFIVSGWYHMIPKTWRDIAPAYGLHASLLPDYSGGAPLVWSLINGEKKTGITLFQMDSGVDSGPIVAQRIEHIQDDDTIATLYLRIENLGLELIKKYIPKLASGDVELRAQDESNRKIMPQRSPDDGLIDWSQSAEYIDRFIRAQTRPYPGAYFFYKSKKVTVWKATIYKVNTFKNKEIYLSGDVFIVDEFLCMYCADDKGLLLNEVTIDGVDYSFPDDRVDFFIESNQIEH